MKKLHLLFILLSILSSANLCAQKMKIVRCTTPTIIIGGIKCNVGDTFDKDAPISWISSKQVMIAKDEKGELVRFAASNKKEKDSFIAKLMNRQTQNLSTREFGADGIDGIYIIDKKLSLPTGLEADKKYKIELHFIVDGKNRIYKAKLNADNSSMTIKKNIFDGRYENIIDAKIIAFENGSDKEILLSEDIKFVHIERALIPE